MSPPIKGSMPIWILYGLGLRKIHAGLLVDMCEGCPGKIQPKIPLFSLLRGRVLSGQPSYFTFSGVYVQSGISGTRVEGMLADLLTLTVVAGGFHWHFSNE